MANEPRDTHSQYFLVKVTTDGPNVAHDEAPDEFPPNTWNGIQYVSHEAYLSQVSSDIIADINELGMHFPGVHVVELTAETVKRMDMV